VQVACRIWARCRSLIGLRHPPRRFGLTAVLRVAAIQFRDGGELAGGHVGFKAVPRGQHSEQLII